MSEHVTKSQVLTKKNTLVDICKLYSYCDPKFNLKGGNGKREIMTKLSCSIETCFVNLKEDRKEAGSSGDECGKK